MPQGVRSGVFRPTLAFDGSYSDFERILQRDKSLLVSTKLDGIRAVVRGGQLVSRTLKPIRNRYIQGLLGRPEFEGLDGELIVGAPNGEGVFARTSSGVMSEFGEPEFHYYVIDNWQIENDFHERYKVIRHALQNVGVYDIPHMSPLGQVYVESLKRLEELEQDYVDSGFEGAIVRSPLSPYKWGRSTAKEGYMGKLKRFLDSEARIVGFEPLRRNENAAEIDHLGLQRRSSHKDNKIEDDLLGALVVEDLKNQNWVFNIGTGFDVSTRDYIWHHQDEYLGKIVSYKYLPVGTIDKPRHPVFKGVRSLDDISR